MNIDLISSIGFTIFAIAYALFIIVFIFLFAVSFVSYHIYERLYKISIINILLSNPTKNDQELIESINSEYIVYNNARLFSFSHLKINIINSKLISELRNNKYKKYYNIHKIKSNDIANKLERINKLIYEKMNFQESDIIQIINEIQHLSVIKSDEKKINEIIEKIKINFISCQEFCNGRIYEKDNQINTLENRLKKHQMNRFLSWLGWIIGIISGIITIFLAIK